MDGTNGMLNFETKEYEEVEIKTDEYYYNMNIKVKATLHQVNFPKTGVMHDFGFAIVKLNPLSIIEGEFHPRAKNHQGMISVKGVMTRIEAGEEAEFTLALDTIVEKFGATYKLLYKRNNFNFEDVNQQKIFFQAFLTDRQIENMFKTFSNPIEVLEKGDIESLCQVSGVGESTAEKIFKKYEQYKNYAEAYVTLSDYDLTTDAIKKLCEKYGSPEALIKIIKENPYTLVEVEGYGFRKADNIALQSGIERDSLTRVMAFIEHTLKEKGEQGYSWIDSSELIYEIEETLGDVEMGTIMDSVNALKEQNKVWNGELGKIGSMRLYRLEEKIVEELFRLMNAERREIPENWEDRVRQAEILQGWEYEDEQIEAIKIILESNVCIITGWAGVGKTATVLGALKALGDISFGMSALSGKASSVLQDSTGYESHTIHRLLRFKEGVFEHNKENPLPYDVVILDETSMVNGNLFYSLIQSIKTGAKFIIMGDVNQIPPIGSLNIFHDLLKSSVVPSRKLTKIHRQARKSGIITNSIQIARGEQLIEKGFEGKETRGELQDFHIDIFDKSWKTFDKVIETFKEKLETVKDYTKISVIVPFNFNGDVSCYNINKTLQEICNPPNPKKNEVEISYAKGKEVIIREGDLVLNTVNNYKLKAVVENDMGFEEVPIFNGFIGTVEKIWHNGNIEIYFHMIDKRVIVTKSHWSEKKAIQHGYCISIHKAQGSQNDYIIVGMDFTHYKMLTSELLYTAITRAKKDCVLISTTQALSHAIRTKDSTQKQTFMVKFLNCKNKLKTEVE